MISKVSNLIFRYDLSVKPKIPGMVSTHLAAQTLTCWLLDSLVVPLSNIHCFISGHGFDSGGRNTPHGELCYGACWIFLGSLCPSLNVLTGHVHSCFPSPPNACSCIYVKGFVGVKSSPIAFGKVLSSWYFTSIPVWECFIWLSHVVE